MASIFSYDPDPPRVSSPWLTPSGSPKPSTPQPRDRPSTSTSPPSGLLADYGVTRLEAEPQEGPTEYKLHLLLRPRRQYSSLSTGSVISGSQQHRQQTATQANFNECGPILAPSNQSRQRRLEQLTTQLLWRLQQSSPYHASSTSDLVLPKLPEATESLEMVSRPGKLLAGLEESRGALYEIGVSDDGTFVGLAKDEIDESLKTLRFMAASLGCNVQVVRMVIVGDCEWHESSATGTSNLSSRDERSSRLTRDCIEHLETLRRQAPLWVAEALVTPDLSPRKPMQSIDSSPGSRQETPPPAPLTELPIPNQIQTGETTEQLRITLTGPTTSGKSSLLGTLSTSTLDNGRGKSRLSLLKHRHEIVSGVTSSVAQELIGYKGNEDFPRLTQSTCIRRVKSTSVSESASLRNSVPLSEGWSTLTLSRIRGHQLFFREQHQRMGRRTFKSRKRSIGICLRLRRSSQVSSTDRMLLIPTDRKGFDRYRRTSEYKILPNSRFSLFEVC
jgi:hypothetical protein